MFVLTTTPAMRRRLASLSAFVLIFPLALGACATSVVDTLPTRTPNPTPGSGACPTESASGGLGGQVYTPHQMRVAQRISLYRTQLRPGKDYSTLPETADA